MLHDAGLVTVRRDGRRRLYQARREPLGPLREVLEDLWRSGLEELKTLAEAEEVGAGGSPRRAGRGAADDRGPARDDLPVLHRPGPLRPLDGRVVLLHPEPGGRLRVGYPTGQVAAALFVAVEPDRRIVFTWGYEGDGQAVPAGSSTVEITLERDAGGTEVRLRHTGLPAGKPPAAHLAGWRHALATLAYAGSAEQFGPVLGERIGDWLAAWNEPDPVRRADLLGRCLADGGRFRDPTTAVDAPGSWPSTSAWSSG